MLGNLKKAWGFVAASIFKFNSHKPQGKKPKRHIQIPARRRPNDKCLEAKKRGGEADQDLHLPSLFSPAHQA
jgi:hypothetical protein